MSAPAPAVASRPYADSSASGEAPLVVVNDVDFAYTEEPVLKGVGFAIASGDLVGIIGPNGSGKSTLVGLVDGINQPSAGEVLVKGVSTARFGRREMAREVALVPQHYNLDFDLAVGEVVRMGAYCRGKEEAVRCDPESKLDRLGIAHLVERPFSALSGGEKQLVVLAQALMQEAPILLLDEPASALDVSHQLRLFNLLRDLNAEGLTVACILHDLNMALQYFDRLLLLDEGEIAALGPSAFVVLPFMLEPVSGVHAFLHHHAGSVYLTYSPRLRRHRHGRVHIVCGGGTGSAMMRELVEAGYHVTVGALNVLDSDEQTGSELGVEMAIEAPFTPIGDEAHAQNVALMRAADLVILSAVPVGAGNARNIQAIREVLGSGVPVWAHEGVRAADLVGATADLSAAGVEFFAGDEALLAAVRARTAARKASAESADDVQPDVVT